MRDKQELAADMKWRTSIRQRPEVRLIFWYLLAAIVWELSISEIILQLPLQQTTQAQLLRWEAWGFALLSILFIYFFTRAWALKLRKSRQLLHNYLDDSPTVHYELRALESDFRIHWVSPNSERIMGYSPEEVKAPGWWQENIHPNDLQVAIKTASRGFKEAQFVYEYRFRHKQGYYVWVRDELRRSSKRPIRFQGSWTNISTDDIFPPEPATEEVSEHGVRSGIALLDSRRKVITVDNVFTEISGLTKKICCDSKLEELLTATEIGDAHHNFSCDKAIVIVGRNAERKRYSAILSIRTLDSDLSEKAVYIATLSDVTRIKLQQRQLQRLAFYDELTGLPNANSLALDLAKLLDDLPSDRLAAVVLMNIDHFHKVNDTYGHHVGDKILQRLTQRLKEAVPFGAKLYNLGGDEFAIVLNHVVEYIDIQNITRQVQLVYEKPFLLPQGQQVTLSASMGTSVYPLDGHDGNKLTAQAQLAMKSAKDQETENSSLFNQELSQTANDNSMLDHEIHSVLQTDQIQLVYQSFLTMDSEVVGVEALTRWEHPELGVLKPSSFLPRFDANGMLDTLGIWVIEHVITQIEQWQEQGVAPKKVAINLATEQISPLLYDTLSRLLMDKPDILAILEFELSESTLHEPLHETLETISQLHQLGVTLVIDRFGKGVASMLHLKNMPISKVKIEREFIRDLDTNPRSESLVKAMIDMISALELDVQAVGVESEEQLKKLKDLGCDYWQGHLHQRAETGDSVLRSNE